MNLHFFGPYPLCSEEHDVLSGCEHAESGGIYLWTVPSEKLGFVVDYVGETGASFYRRTKDHLIQSLGGNYAIFDPSELLEGKQRFVWRGLWRRGTRDRLPQFLSGYERLAPTIKEYLLLHRVFLAPIDCERRLRQRIEGALASAIRQSKHQLIPDDIRYISRRSEEQLVELALSCDSAIAGMPSTLSA